MKKSIVVLGVSAVVAATLLMSCNNAAKNVDDAQENVAEAENDMAEAQDDLAIANAEYLADVENYKLETEARVERNNAMIAELRAKKVYAKNQTKEAYEKAIADLEQKNLDLQIKMRDYKADGKDSWESFKAEFSHDMEEVENGFKSIGNNDVK